MAEIRNYEAGDYEAVCRIFKEGMHENWWPAYRSYSKNAVLVLDL